MNYYDIHAELFFNRTVNANMAVIYEPFVKHLPKEAKILDIGCGSGRDLKYFKEQGFNPIGIEPSTKLAELSAQHSKCLVYETTIADFTLDQTFDGIWACASLLHLNDQELRASFNKISSLMTKNSVLYCSFKHGDFSGVRGDRYFNDQTLESVRELLPKGLEISSEWESKDVQDRSGTEWVNFIIVHSV